MRYSYVLLIEGYPSVLRRCARCGEKKPFVPSGQVRINAQKKLLDVWLIHKCQSCGQTWNMEVYERVSPAQLDRGTYERLLSNDPDLVRALAFDARLHARAGAPLCPPEELCYRIMGERLNADELTGPAELKIACLVPAGVRLSKLLREILGLSARGFEALVASGRLSSADGRDILKARMGTECTIRVEPM
jgi:hypothetical protein